MASDIRASQRVSSLDGLRGVAALIVVVQHCALVSPALAAGYYGGDVGGLANQIALYSPLHLFWGGAEAVVVFFVLSGVVLVRAMRSSRFTWGSYFPSRLVRLWLPVVGAVALGYLLLAVLPTIFPKLAGTGTSSPWLDRPFGYPFEAVAQDLALLGGTSGIVSPLWTLRWEIIFSLLLPVLAFAARLIPAWLFGVVCIALSATGAATHVAALQYLPIFGVGVALAFMWERLDRAGTGIRRGGSAVAWTAGLIAIVLAMTSKWTLRPVLDDAIVTPVSQVLIVSGAAALVYAAARCRPLNRLLSIKPIAWLGAVSFSLYLVHEPFVVTYAHLTGSAKLTLLLAVPTALLAAWLFWLVLERPVHHLSRRVRDRVATKELTELRARVQEQAAASAPVEPGRGSEPAHPPTRPLSVV